MAEQRRVIETEVDVATAYQKCFKRATQTGWDIRANVPGQRLELERVERSAGWWCAVIFGFLFYIIPGVLVLFLWRTKHECCLLFEPQGKGTEIVARINGKEGVTFYNEMSGVLL